MTELELYKYLFDPESGINPEMHWHGDELNVFLYYFQLEDFVKEVCDEGMFDDGGLEAHMKGNYIVFDFVPILEYLDIEPTNIFPNKED